MNKTVFLTGGAGRIGKKVLIRLLDRGYKVKVLVYHREPEGVIHENMELVRGDILQPKSLLNAVKGCQVVCHLASVFDMFGAPKYEKDNDVMYENIVTGTYNVLEAARSSETTERFVYASTDAVFSAIYKKYDAPVTEDVEVSPRRGRFYAVAKAVTESMCINYQKSYGLPYTIIRIGWCLDEDEVLKTFAFEFWEGLVDPKDREVYRPKLANGKGAMAPLYQTGDSVAVQLGHAEDTAAGIALAIEQQERARNQIFNIAGEAPFRYLDVIDKVAHGLGVPWEGVKVLGLEEYEISNDKAKKLLGYCPEWDVNAMIEKGLAKGGSLL